MAKSVAISCPPTFDAHGENTSLGARWTKWQNGFNTYLLAAGITDENQKKALLLHCAGDSVQEIFETLPNSGTTYVEATTALKSYFIPKQNKHFERHIFRTHTQKSGERIDSYVTKLRQLASSCEFHNTDEEIIDQIIEKCYSSKLRRTLLKESDLTLDFVIKTAQSMELSEKQAKLYPSQEPIHIAPEIEFTEETINKINPSPRMPFPKSRTTYSNPPNRHHKRAQTTQCYRCGQTNHLAHQCTLDRNIICLNCGKKGHLRKICQSSQQKKNTFQNTTQQIKYINLDGSSSDDDTTFTIREETENENTHPHDTNEITYSLKEDKPYKHSITINNNTVVNTMIDSGSSVNIIDMKTYETLVPKPIIHPHDKKILTFNSKIPLQTEGIIDVHLSANEKSIDTKFLVLNTADCAILGIKDALQLDLLRVGPPTYKQDSVNNITENYVKELLEKYKTCFKGLGRVKNVSVTMQVDPSTQPVAQRPRRLPILLQKKVDNEIQRLLELDVIEKSPSPPTWVNPIHIVDKPNGDIRLCLDMRRTNSAIIREPYQIPTLEEFCHDFNGCKYFAKLDLNQGYHQILLHPSSRHLTTFATSKGFMQFKVLLYGIAPAAEIYQREMEHVLQGLDKVKNISDDIIIGGKSKDELSRNLEKTLQRLQENNITLNYAKCKFCETEITYMGHVLSENGISPEPAKVEAIKNLKPPSNVTELRSFLGMVTYCGSFIENLATVTKPLRSLLKKDSDWMWSEQQQKAFNQLKQNLSNAKTLAYFDPNTETHVITDASPYGIGAILSQKQKDGYFRPVSFTSRSLTNTEQKYSQIEREALAIFFGIERFRNYLYGMNFTVITDHKPLVSLFTSTSQPPPRIERWIMKLTKYNFNIVYKPGQDNHADYLSRSNPLQSPHHDVSSDNYVNFVIAEAIPTSMSLEDIRKATLLDKDITNLKYHLKAGKFPKSGSFAPYTASKTQFTIHQDICLHENKIVIPESLRSRIIELAHEGHQGITRTKQRLRTKVWWPGINSDVEQYITACHPCQVVQPAEHHTPLKMTKIPAHAWLLLGYDICGPFPTGENLLVCVDYYSRFPEVEIVRKVTTDIITSKLRKLFNRYGPPEELVTDNGPQFTSTDFETFMQEYNVKHRRVTPYHPQSNGEVERFNRTLKKTIQSAIAEEKDWRIVLENFLLSYRTTPHATTGFTPARLMFGREIRDKLPQIPNKKKNQTTINKQIQNKDSERKELIKKYADNANRSKETTLKPGDYVLVSNKHKKKNKFTTNWHYKPAKVLRVKGNSILFQHQGKKYLRNSTDLRLFHGPTQNLNQTTNHHKPMICQQPQHLRIIPPSIIYDDPPKTNENIPLNTIEPNINNETPVEEEDNDVPNISTDQNDTDESDDTIPYAEATLTLYKENRPKRQSKPPQKLNDYQT